MARRILLFVLGLLLLYPGISIGADSCPKPVPKHSSQAKGYYVVVWEWSNTDGAVTCTTTDALWGYIIQVKFVPDGTNQPDSSYNVYGYDYNNYDLFQGEGTTLDGTDQSDRSNIATPLTQEGAYVGMWGERVTLTVSGTGAAGAETDAGKVYMIVKEF